LIDDGLEREAGDVKEIAAFDFARVANGIFGAFANDVEFAFKGQVVGEVLVAANEDLAHERLGGFGRFAEGSIVRRYRSPAKEPLAFFGNNGGKNFFALGPLSAVVGKEDHANAVFA